MLVVLCLVLAAGCGSNTQVKKDKARAAQQMGLAYLNEGQPARALQELVKAERLTPEDAEIKNSLAIAYWARGEQLMAEKKFQEAVALNPEYSEAWNNLGALYIDLKQYEKAIKACQKALGNVFYTTSERALANMGWSYYKLGRLSEARNKLQEAISVSPTYPVANRNLAIVLQELGEHESALKYFEKAINVFPNDALTHLHKGMSQLKTDDREGAKASFQLAWRLAAGTDLGKSAKAYLDILK